MTVNSSMSSAANETKPAGKGPLSGRTPINMGNLTSNPMGFLNAVLSRPDTEKPHILLVVGHPPPTRWCGRTPRPKAP
jgi:hypothetical protein